MNTGFLQQQSLLGSAAVRSAPSPQHGAHLIIPTPAPALRLEEDHAPARPPRRKPPLTP